VRERSIACRCVRYDLVTKERTESSQRTRMPRLNWSWQVQYGIAVCLADYYYYYYVVFYVHLDPVLCSQAPD